jgi:hypothetical protein
MNWFELPARIVKAVGALELGHGWDARSDLRRRADKDLPADAPRARWRRRFPSAILGRFTDEWKAVLDAVREELPGKG